MLATNLPPITDPVTIDGTTQPGLAGAPIIEIKVTTFGAFDAAIIQSAGPCTRA